MFKFTKNIRLPLLVTSTFVFNSNCEKSESKDVSDSSDHIVLHLSIQSHANLSNHLSNIGFGDYVPSKVVMIRRNSDNETIYRLEPLFCNKAAFRLKGIMKSANGSVVVSI